VITDIGKRSASAVKKKLHCFILIYNSLTLDDRVNMISFCVRCNDP